MIRVPGWLSRGVAGGTAALACGLFCGCGDDTVPITPDPVPAAGTADGTGAPAEEMSTSDSITGSMMAPSGRKE